MNHKNMINILVMLAFLSLIMIVFKPDTIKGQEEAVVIEEQGGEILSEIEVQSLVRVDDIITQGDKWWQVRNGTCFFEDEVEEECPI